MATETAVVEADYLAEMADRARTQAHAAQRYDDLDRARIRTDALRAIRRGDIAAAVAALRGLPPAEQAPIAEALRRIGRRRGVA